ncbi:MAG TPA: acyltransferase domain-containing protein [Acidimicrobiales bacterium]|nr:acyltransferase domain-containing protein [Acidimicrobiales bacterium]
MMSLVDAPTVAGSLGLEGAVAAWVDSLSPVSPEAGGIDLPSPDRAEALLAALGVDPEDALEVVDTLPSPASTPEIWWMLTRCHRLLCDALGRIDEPRGWWPRLPASLGARGGCFYAHLFLAMIPDTLGWHQAHGVPEDISWDTFSDLSRHMRIHRQKYGTVGVDEPWWMTLHLRGEVYECGRLQFDMHRLGKGEIAWDLREPGMTIGDEAIGVHIPEAGPMTEELCDRSFGIARELFPRAFPGSERRVATCTSWLLDDQLLEYLPTTSNISRFQSRFNLLPTAVDDDEGVLGFVFHRPGEVMPVLDTLPQETALQRALVAHIRSGRHWRVRTGWLEL